MASTAVTSVRLDRADLKALDALASRLKLERSTLIKRALSAGVREVLLDEAVAQYQKGRVSAWYCAREARVSFAEFLDELKQRGIPFRTDEDLLREQVEALVGERRRR